MGRNICSIMQKELENLDKDADSRKLAMKSLKSYVKDLDSKLLPHFIAQVSETKETGESPGEYAISLYEVLARVHGPKVVPHIDHIMTSIIKTLTSSAGCFALHQACSKVVPAIARYGIDPTTPEEKKRFIIHSICKPLSDCLLGSQESLSSGVALCLKALVDSDNWRFASGEMVNEVCQKVTGALGKPAQTNSHMALVMALAKHNSLTVEAYARLLIQSGLRILTSGVEEGNSQKRLSAIQMINFLIKSLDPKSIVSELTLIIQEMEKCQFDQMAYVKGAAFEALQTAKRIAAEKGSKFDKGVSSVNGSNNRRRENCQRRNKQCIGDQSPLIASPESQTVDSFIGYDSLIESPVSTSPTTRCLDYYHKSVNRKQWQRYENGGVDVSLKDGLFSEVTQEGAAENCEDGVFSDNQEHYRDEYAGYLQESQRNEFLRSATPSPQRSCSQINVDNFKIYTTPRNLIRCLQDANDVSSEFSNNQIRRFRSPAACNFELSPAHYVNHEIERQGNSIGDEICHDSSESVSSTEDVRVDADVLVPPGISADVQNASMRSSHQKSMLTMIVTLFLTVFLAFIWMLWTDDGQELGHDLIPT